MDSYISKENAWIPSLFKLITISDFILPHACCSKIAQYSHFISFPHLHFLSVFHLILDYSFFPSLILYLYYFSSNSSLFSSCFLKTSENSILLSLFSPHFYLYVFCSIYSSQSILTCHSLQICSFSLSLSFFFFLYPKFF